MRALDALIPIRSARNGSQRTTLAEAYFDAGNVLNPFGLGGFQTFSVGGQTYTVPVQTTMGSQKAESIANSFEGYVLGGLAGNSVIFTLESARLRVFSQARFQFQNFNKGRPGDLFANADLAILERPWPGGVTGDLLAAMLLSADFGGNSYVTKINGQLVPMRPDWVEIMLGERAYMDDTGFSGSVGMEKLGYLYYQGGRSSGVKPVAFLADQVCHFAPQPDPLAWYRGMSWMTPVVREIQADGAAMSHKLKYFENAAPQPLDAKILTPDGWSTMGDMQVGSLVIGADGKGHEVTGVYPQGEQDIYRVTFSGGEQVECTLDHIWCVANNHDRKSGTHRTLTLRQIMEGGTAYKSGLMKWAVPFAEPTEFADPGALPLDPYLLGALLCDGSFHEKEIPEQYLRASACDRLALLQGLIDTNGHIGKSQGNLVRFTTTSGALARNMVDLVGSLGGATSVVHAPVPTECGATAWAKWDITIKGLPEWMVPCRLERKTALYKKVDRVGRYRHIRSVDLVDRRLAQCIRVDVSDHLYVTNDYILTHNTSNLAITLNTTDIDQFNAFVDKMDEAHQGWQNAYKNLYLGAGADVTVIGGNMQQLDFANVIGKGETRLAGAAGVPPSVAGLSEGLQGSSLNAGNFSAARRQFADTTLSHLWGNVAGSLEMLVKPPHGGTRLWYDIRDIPFLREDMKDLAAIQASKAQAVREYFMAGFEPKSILASVAADDITLLVHTGVVSVQVQTPGSNSRLLSSAVDELPDDLKVNDPEVPAPIPAPVDSFKTDFVAWSARADQERSQMTAMFGAALALAGRTPEVTVNPPQITVEAPSIHVDAPSITVEPPQVVVNIPPTQNKQKQIQRDADGNLVGIIETDV